MEGGRGQPPRQGGGRGAPTHLLRVLAAPGHRTQAALCREKQDPGLRQRLSLTPGFQLSAAIAARWQQSKRDYWLP